LNLPLDIRIILFSDIDIDMIFFLKQAATKEVMGE